MALPNSYDGMEVKKRELSKGTQSKEEYVQKAVALWKEELAANDKTERAKVVIVSANACIARAESAAEKSQRTVGKAG